MRLRLSDRPSHSLPCTRRTAAAWLVALPTLGALWSSSSAAEPVGLVESAEGRSTGSLDGVSRDLAVNVEVFLNELVETDAASRLGMALGASTTVRLGELTRLIIERAIVDQGGELVLERGAILFEESSGEDSGVVVDTPFAIIAARGTRFFVGPSNGVIGVFVEEGSVSVTNNAGEVILEANQGTDLTSPDIPPTPPSEWGEQRKDAALASVT